MEFKSIIRGVEMTGRKCKNLNKSISLLLALLLLFVSCGSKTENAAQSGPEPAQSAATEPNAGAEPAPESEPEAPEAPAPAETEPEQGMEETHEEPKNGEEAPEQPKEEEETVENEDWKKLYEAEDAKLTSNDVLTSGANGTSGKKYVGKFESSSSKAEFTVTVPEEGLYELYIASIGIWGEKVAKLSVNGKEQGEFTVKNGSTPSEVEMQVYLNAGENTVTVLPSWTWFGLDYIRLDKPSEDRLAAALAFDRELSNPNAGDSAKKLWAFLTENYGNHVLVGQVSDRLSDPEMPAIKKATGTYPAIMGFDFMDYTPSRRAHGTNPDAVDQALTWVKKHKGLVTFHWHWNVPEPYLIDQGQGKLESGQDWWSGFYQTAVDAKKFDLKKIMNGEDQEGYDLLMRDIDAIAEQLLRLKDKGIPVLWRPLHEASGKWFWWGAYGPEAYKKLYVTLYDRLTNVHGLDNLIWVWNCDGADWFPGAEYVDIVSCDVAGTADYGSLQGRYYEKVEEMKQIGVMKLIAISETGWVPDIDNIAREQAWWSYIVTWRGMDTVSKTSDEQLKKMYSDERVLTVKDVAGLN
ncbi:MAG: hypothetical protein IKQ92_13470 [Clostridia bacterium]|nr:hypothetical protein [Clostridia bacterium]